MKGRIALGLVLLACGIAVVGQWLHNSVPGKATGVMSKAPVASAPETGIGTDLLEFESQAGVESLLNDLVAAPVVSPQKETLPPSTALVRVKGRTPDGHGVMGVLVELSSSEPLFGGKTGKRRGPPPTMRRVGKGLGLADFEDVLPGVQADARILDRTGRELGRTAVAPLAPGETRVIEVAIPVQPVDAIVSVVDPFGWPVADATVSLGASAQGVQATSWISAKTNEQGRVTLSRLAPGSVSVRVSYFGTEVYFQPVQELPAQGQVLQVGIDRGRRVTVRGIDSTGRSIPLDWVVGRSTASGPPRLFKFVVDPSDPTQATWFCDAMPTGELLISAAASFQFIETRSASDHVQLVQPDTEMVEVTWSPEVQAGACACIVTPVGGRSRQVEISNEQIIARRLILHLEPGRSYRIELSVPGDDTFDARYPDVPVAPAQEIEVRSGGSARVHFDRR